MDVWNRAVQTTLRQEPATQTDGQEDIKIDEPRLLETSWRRLVLRAIFVN